MTDIITLRLGTSQFSRAIRDLKDKAHIAVARSLRRAAVSARTVMAREVANDIGIAVNVAKEGIEINEQKVESDHTIRIICTGARIPLIKMNARGLRPSRGQGSGVSVRMKGGRQRYPKAFIATMKSGHEGVFARPDNVPSVRMSRGARSKNLPIAELHGPSMPHVFSKHSDKGQKAGEESLIKNLQHEFKWALEQARQGS